MILPKVVVYLPNFWKFLRKFGHKMFKNVPTPDSKVFDSFLGDFPEIWMQNVK